MGDSINYSVNAGKFSDMIKDAVSSALEQIDLNSVKLTDEEEKELLDKNITDKKDWSISDVHNYRINTENVYDFSIKIPIGIGAFIIVDGNNTKSYEKEYKIINKELIRVYNALDRVIKRATDRVVDVNKLIENTECVHNAAYNRLIKNARMDCSFSNDIQDRINMFLQVRKCYLGNKAIETKYKKMKHYTIADVQYLMELKGDMLIMEDYMVSKFEEKLNKFIPDKYVSGYQHLGRIDCDGTIIAPVDDWKQQLLEYEIQMDKKITNDFRKLRREVTSTFNIAIKRLRTKLDNGELVDDNDVPFVEVVTLEYDPFVKPSKIVSNN